MPKPLKTRPGSDCCTIARFLNSVELNATSCSNAPAGPGLIAPTILSAPEPARGPVAKTSVWFEGAASTTLGLAVIRARFFEPPCIVAYLAPGNIIAKCLGDKAKRVY